MAVVAFIHAVEEVNPPVNPHPASSPREWTPVAPDRPPVQSKPQVRFCSYIKDNGIRCATPAIAGRNFCYYHSRAHHPGARVGTRRYRPPLPDSVAGLQIALAHTLQALTCGDLSPKQANSMMYGISLATNMLRHAKPLTEAEQQQVVTEIPPEMEEVLTPPDSVQDLPCGVATQNPDTPAEPMSRREEIKRLRTFVQPLHLFQQYEQDYRNFDGSSDINCYYTSHEKIMKHNFAIKRLRELGAE